MNYDSKPVKSSSLLFMALEGRALIELAALLIMLPVLKMGPRGDGHPVLVLPGFLFGDWSTTMLRWFLNDRGFLTNSLQLDNDTGYSFSENTEREFENKLIAIYKHYGKKVSIIGWNTGGLYARELSCSHPEMVRCVITLGTPFSKTNNGINIWRLYEFICGQKFQNLDSDLISNINIPLLVPTTSIYSRSDSFAGFECCINRTSPFSENIEVQSSHCGLVLHPLVLLAIADRLSQPENQWQPFERKGLRSILYRKPENLQFNSTKIPSLQSK